MKKISVILTRKYAYIYLQKKTYNFGYYFFQITEIFLFYIKQITDTHEIIWLPVGAVHMKRLGNTDSRENLS